MITTNAFGHQKWEHEKQLQLHFLELIYHQIHKLIKKINVNNLKFKINFNFLPSFV